MTVEGETAAGFEPVKAVFHEHVAHAGDGGAGFAAVGAGCPVVDLWAGMAGEEPRRRETRGIRAVYQCLDRSP